MVLPNLANNGPITKKEALILFISSIGASYPVKFDESICTVFFSKNSTFAPNDFNTSNITSISLNFGTFSKIIGSVPNKEAAIIGKAAFLAPSILTVPVSGPLFVTTIFSTVPPFFIIILSIIPDNYIINHYLLI